MASNDPAPPAPTPRRAAVPRPVGAAAPPPPPTPAAAPPPLETYLELERILFQVNEALETAESFESFQELLAERDTPEGRVRQMTALTLGGDLHLHSNASDGRLPARKLPWLARALGLRVIALTDHDSIDGCRDAFREGTLVGVQVLPGVEFSTGRLGLEILTYFPDAGRLFAFLASSRSARFREALQRRQDVIHQTSLACLEHVNVWLARQKVPPESLITLAEFDRWFGGQKPYFPGTLCVLGLKRLTMEQRARLKISDPRAFNTKVVTPFLRDYALKAPPGAAKSSKQPADLLEEAFQLVRLVQRAGVPAATFLAHPRELVTKGRMSLGAVRRLVFDLADRHGLDGLEVACSRDGDDDIRYWKEIAAEYGAALESRPEKGRKGKQLLEASHSSDFHVLGPGLATGEITLGFGVLDSRPQFRRGNLRPQLQLDEFLEQLRRRAAENASS